MLRLSALLLLAQGARQAAAARVQVNMSELEGADMACYCQEVESMEGCPDNKYRKEPERSDGPRYFHAGDQGKKSLCCKLEEQSMFNFVGFAYTKQDTLDLCSEEVRVLPEAKCCRLQDGSHGSMAVRVNSARSEARTGNSYGVPTFFKSSPIVQLEDITSAEDYNGAKVPRAQLQAFLESRRFTPSKLECLGTMEALLADQRKDCRLRETTTRDCCCNEASLTAAVRCLPVEGAATEEQAAPLYLDATVKPATEHGYIKDTVYHASPPDEAGHMPELLEGVADPKQQDLPETPMDEASMLFSWAKTQQWSASCSHWGDINVVKTRKETKKVPNGENCVSRKVGAGYQRHCTKKYKQVTTYHYSQGKERACLQRKWVRNCPAGHGFYRKSIDPGTCMGEDSGLQQVAPLSYACPAGYRSGKEEEEHSDLEQCKCQTDCS